MNFWWLGWGSEMISDVLLSMQTVSELTILYCTILKAGKVEDMGVVVRSQ